MFFLAALMQEPIARLMPAIVCRAPAKLAAGTDPSLIPDSTGVLSDCAVKKIANGSELSGDEMIPENRELREIAKIHEPTAP